ncbi:MAG: hypothetical protein P8Z72_00465 [Gammaproteobacteria bacterium]
MNSLRSRLILAASVVLAVFIVIAGYTLDKAPGFMPLSSIKKARCYGNLCRLSVCVFPRHTY